MEIKVRVTRAENAAYFACTVGETVRVEFEDYVAAVTASELASGGTDGCRAQAVAARTFAVARGVLDGAEISDSSAEAQAYRAARNDLARFPDAVLAARDTAGVILCWNGQAVSTPYCAGNGGRTVSAEEAWGSKRPWLIAKDDPWDRAAGGGKNGHGVGMSQQGARWAGQHGFTWKQILQRYYPGTVLASNYGRPVMNEKAEEIVRAAYEQIGAPYVYGALGEACTPSNRGRRQRADRPTIKEKCQVLMKRAGTCAGCAYEGRLMFDCRGLTWWLLNRVGIKISTVGATTQWNTANDWAARGSISDGLPDCVCCVFQRVGNKMAHTGMHTGGGRGVQASVGVNEFVLDKTWTHWGIPKGLYSEKEIAEMGVVTVTSILKRGSKGANVKALQENLTRLGYDCGSADGAFGAKTENAVKAFQRDKGLTADGIAGTLTQTAIDKALAEMDAPEKPEETKTVEERLEALERFALVVKAALGL